MVSGLAKQANIVGQCTEELLHLLMADGLKRKTIPPTRYLLRKTEHWFHDSLPKQELVLEHEGEKHVILYNTIEGIIDHVLKTPELMQGKSNFL